MSNPEQSSQQQVPSATTAQRAPAGAGAPSVSGWGRAAAQLKASLRGHDYATQVQMLAPESAGSGRDASVHAAAARGTGGSGGKLPYGDQIQRSFGGCDISNVQAHADANATAATATMGADAYATGNHVVLGAGGKDLHTVAHEAAHVVQLRAGVSLSGGVGQAGDAHERHADRVADAVVEGKSAESLLGQMPGGGARGDQSNVQMQECTASMMSEPEAEVGSAQTEMCEAPTDVSGTETIGRRDGATVHAHHAPQRESESPERAESPATADDARAGVSAPQVAFPTDFSQEGVLQTWIGEFNRSLAKRGARSNAKLDALKNLGWADDAGLNYAKLATAARAEASAKQQTGQDHDGASQHETAMILKMLAKGNRVLFNVITPDYQGLCMQFSEKLMAELGARRVDGTTNEKRGLSTKKGPLTAEHRGKHVKELPATLPAGYQVCVVSRPDWGFTEVGNHWFITAGDGYYLDNTMGVVSGAGMTASLIKTTGDQWANRLFDLDKNALRRSMALKFVDANPSLAQYLDRGRTDREKKGTVRTNLDHKSADGLEVAGREAVARLVKGDEQYHPRIWLVEPTQRA